MWSTQSKALAYDWIVFHCMITPYFVYFFIYSSADAHRLLPLLAIVNNVAINIHLQVFVWMCIFTPRFHLGVCLVMEGLDCMMTPCLTFWGTDHFPKQLHYVTSPPAMCKSTRFFNPHQHLSDFLILAILEGVEWDLTVFFICVLLMTNDAEHLLCAHWPFVYLGEMSNQIFYPFLNSVICPEQVSLVPVWGPLYLLFFLLGAFFPSLWTAASS